MTDYDGAGVSRQAQTPIDEATSEAIKRASKLHATAIKDHTNTEQMPANVKGGFASVVRFNYFCDKVQHAFEKGARMGFRAGLKARPARPEITPESVLMLRAAMVDQGLGEWDTFDDTPLRAIANTFLDSLYGASSAGGD